MESPGAQPQSRPIDFSLTPWLTFKNTVPFQPYSRNTVPFQPYLSFIPSSAPHQQSDLLSLWFKKTCLSVLPFTPGPTAFIQNTLLPTHNTCIYRTNTAVPQDPYTVTFFLKPLLVTPLLSLCLFTSVPLFYSCSILQLLDLVVLRDVNYITNCMILLTLLNQPQGLSSNWTINLPMHHQGQCVLSHVCRIQLFVTYGL